MSGISVDYYDEDAVMVEVFFFHCVGPTTSSFHAPSLSLWIHGFRCCFCFLDSYPSL